MGLGPHWQLHTKLLSRPTKEGGKNKDGDSKPLRRITQRIRTPLLKPEKTKGGALLSGRKSPLSKLIPRHKTKEPVPTYSGVNRGGRKGNIYERGG